MTIKVLMPERARLHAGYHAELTTHPLADVEYTFSKNVLYCPVEMLASMSSRLSLQPMERNKYANDEFDNIPYFLSPSLEQADLIHSHLHPVLNDKQFVLDLDAFLFPWTVTSEEFGRMKRLEISCVPRNVDMERVGRLATHLAKPTCQSILAWSPHVRDAIGSFIEDQSVLQKVEVLYPAVYPLQVSAKSDGVVRIMFCGSAGSADSFIRKGGDDVFCLFDRLRTHFEVELCYVGFVPNAIRSKYVDRQDVQIFNRLSKEDLFVQYSQSHVFLLPSRFDTFGMVLLEAMNHELPIVATLGEQFPSNHVVDDDYGGFLVPMVDRDITEDWSKSLLKEVVDRPKTPSIHLDKAMDCLSRLVENPELRCQMGRFNKSQILDGKFSITRRNQRLAEIYMDALRG